MSRGEVVAVSAVGEVVSGVVEDVARTETGHEVGIGAGHSCDLGAKQHLGELYQ